MSRLARVRFIGCVLLGLLAAGHADAEPGAEREPPAPIPAAPAAKPPSGGDFRTSRGALYALMSGGAVTHASSAAVEAARRFYVARDDALAWVGGGTPTPQARALVEAIRAADGKGLDPEDYGAAGLERWLAAGAPASNEEEEARLDVAITLAAASYVSDLQSGRVDARRLGADLGPTGRPEDPSSFLARLVAAPDVPAALATVEPPYAAYRRTLAALRRYLALAREDPGPPLSVPRVPVRPGDAYPEAARLEALLRRLGDLPAGTGPSSAEGIYDGALMEGVRRFQERHGLDPDGALGARTLAALNTPLTRRVAQLGLVLERWRSVPRTLAGPILVVNVPEYRLRALDSRGRGSLSMKVVVGRAFRYQTPLLSAQLTTVIFRPCWNVPRRIQREELVPRLERDPAALVRDGYQVVDTRGSVVAEGPIGPAVLERLRAGTLRLRQRPGSMNALGKVKFNFPNHHDVYMHGTPSAAPFRRARRAISHGCIRVEDPQGLAEWVLHGAPDWTPERIRAAMEGERTLEVPLSSPIPVLLVYGTAVVAEDGTVRFLEDVYGHDAALERALAGRPARTLAR